MKGIKINIGVNLEYYNFRERPRRPTEFIFSGRIFFCLSCRLIVQLKRNKKLKIISKLLEIKCKKQHGKQQGLKKKFSKRKTKNHGE